MEALPGWTGSDLADRFFAAILGMVIGTVVALMKLSTRKMERKRSGLILPVPILIS